MVHRTSVSVRQDSWRTLTDKNDVLALSEIVWIPIVTTREALEWVD